MSLSPNTALAHYTIVSLIGAGGMGEVYRARDTRLDRDVAIKLLPTEVSIDIARNTSSRLTSNAGEDRYPTWSADDSPRWMDKISRHASA